MGWKDAPEVEPTKPKWATAPEVPKDGPSPAMAAGMSRLSDMTRNPAATYDAAQAERGGIGQDVTNTAAQFGVGTQSGIASALGFPVDMLTGAINGAGELTGGWGPIENPVGGSAMFDEMFAPLNESIPEPQTGVQRFARRIGEEVGGSSVMAPVAVPAAIARGKLLPLLAGEGASAVGAGTAAQTAREVAPDSDAAEFIAALLGGGLAGVGTSSMLGGGGTDAVVRGGIDEQKMRAADAYGEVRADPRILPQDSVDDMALGISERMDAERLNPRLQPGSSAILDAILQDSSGPMRIEDVENLRRVTTSALPATASPADRRLSEIMRTSITDYLDNLNDPVADALTEGRTAYRRASAATAVSDAAEKATRRAARTGSGGNEINATRQNLSSIIENPRRARSFTPDELAQMDGVVRGTSGQNALRSLSRFAPTSGGLSAMLGVGGAMASPAIALPIMAVTEGAKALGERSTRKSLADLLQSLAPDKVLRPREEGVNGVVATLLAGRTMAGGE